jgi:cell wall-associated NlpC family hydrolase
LGSSRTNIIKDKIVQNARKFIGTPFRHSGRSTLGIDCAGLLYLSYSRAGIELPKSDGMPYTVAWWKQTGAKERLLNALLGCGFRILSNNELYDKADIVLFKLYGNHYPAHHSGIMIDDKYFIHAKCGWKSRDKRVSFDSLESSYSKKLAYILRYREFD